MELSKVLFYSTKLHLTKSFLRTLKLCFLTCWKLSDAIGRSAWLHWWIWLKVAFCFGEDRLSRPRLDTMADLKLVSLSEVGVQHVSEVVQVDEIPKNWQDDSSVGLPLGEVWLLYLAKVSRWLACFCFGSRAVPKLNNIKKRESACHKQWKVLSF